MAGSASPYLRHHADDAIHWQPWGKNAQAQARKEDKLIFLSIGYAACHWCRVMGQETFSDPEVAQELNRHFISILVDREERPDLDAYYLRVADSMNGVSGWPQNIFLSPTLLPLFAGNYHPPTPQEGAPGFKSILLGLAKAWTENRPDQLSQEQEIRAQLQAIACSIWQEAGGKSWQVSSPGTRAPRAGQRSGWVWRYMRRQRLIFFAPWHYLPMSCKRGRRGGQCGFPNKPCTVIIHAHGILPPLILYF